MKERYLAESAGFCYGVRRAIAMAEAEAPGGCYVLGELLASTLLRRGIIFADKKVDLSARRSDKKG